jgi:Calcineurin-like phosphoesterase
MRNHLLKRTRRLAFVAGSVAALAVAIAPTPALAAAATIGGVADTDIYKNEASGRPTQTWFGTKYDPLYETRAYITFAVSGIPTGATINSATLSLYCDDGSTDGPAIRAVNAFNASTLSWSTQPTDAATVDDDDKGVVTAPSTVNFNIARTVRGNGTYYFKLYQTGTDFTGCLSMEAASNRPSVSVQYTATASERATIAVFGDTQMLAQPIGGGAGPLAGDMNRSMTWLQANAPALNLKFLVQLGDLTNGVFQTDATPSTNSLGYTEFQYAKLAMDKLLPSAGAKVPWTVSLGNHDMDEWCWAPNFPATNYNDPRCTANGLIGTTRTTNKFTAVFPQSYFSAMSTWGAAAVGSTASTVKVDNNYHKFTIGGQPWLVIALKWNPDAADLAWARSVIDAHASAKVIIATHAYKYPNGYLSKLSDPGNSSGTRASNGQLIYDNLISQRPAIRLVLSGHNDRGRVYSNDGSKQCIDPTNTSTFEKCAWLRYEMRTVPASSANGNVQYTVHEILTDYSVAADRADGYTSTTSTGGAVQISRRLDDNNYFRLLTFDPSNKSIRVKTIAAPTNVALGSTNCLRSTTISPELGTAAFCAKYDAAYNTSQDDYVITNAW